MKIDYEKELLMGKALVDNKFGHFKPAESYKSRNWVDEDYKFFIIITWTVEKRNVYAHAFNPLSLDPLTPEIIESANFLKVMSDIMEWCQVSRLNFVGVSK